MNTDALLLELSEAREDERHSQNQILTTLATAAAVLALILGTALFDDELFNELPNFCRYLIYILGNMILAAAIFYVVTLGISNVLRFHYIREVEDTLLSRYEEQTLTHWFNFQSVINTKNIKHIFYSPYTFASYLCYSIATILLILFCLGLTTAQYFFLKLDFQIFIYVPYIIVILTICVYFIFTIKAKDMYKFSRDLAFKKYIKRRRDSKLNDNKSSNTSLIRKGFLYYLYPKTKDFQKSLIVLIGYVLGSALTCKPSELLNALTTNLKDIFIIFLVVEFLIYQARYMLNDIRGLTEDLCAFKATNSTNKFLVEYYFGVNKSNKSLHKILRLSLFVILARVFIAICLIYVLGATMKIPLIICCLLILVTTFLYELARKYKKSIAVLILVTTGYPLRLLAGMWCAKPTLFETISLSDKLSISPTHILLYLISIAAMGGFSVMIPWIYEAFHQKKNGKIIVKQHYRFLFDSFETRYNNYVRKVKNIFFPLTEKGKITDPWNLCLLLSMTLLSVIGVDFVKSDILFIIIEILNFVVFFGIARASNKKIFVFAGINFLIVIMKCFFAVSILDGILLYSIIGIYLHQGAFTLLYTWLRCCFDPKFIFFEFIICILIGEDTMNLLKRESTSKALSTSK